MIRPADVRDVPRLREIERAAGEAFRAIGMAAIADDEPPTLAELAAYQARGRALVADDGAVVMAYLLIVVVDGAAHVEQVSVDPAYGQRGLGRMLIDAAERWAVAEGLGSVTLTTFADVAWNAPYYARLGFTVMAEDELGPQLRQVRRHEHELGLDAWPRVCMRRPVVDR